MSEREAGWVEGREERKEGGREKLRARVGGWVSMSVSGSVTACVSAGQDKERRKTHFTSSIRQSVG